MFYEYKLISVDDHVFEAPDAYQKRVPARLRDRAPRIVDMPDGSQAWTFDGQVRRIGGLDAVAGKKSEEVSPDPVKGGYAALTRAFWDPKARLKAMDQDGVDAEVLFPGLAGFGGGGFFGVKDPALRSACYRAYNDHLAEDWRIASPQRFVAQCSLPIYDVEEAVGELRRAYDVGHRSVTFPSNPGGWGFAPLADAHWDPLWATIQELEIPVSIHIGGGAPARGQDNPMFGAATSLHSGAKGTVQSGIVKALSSNITTMAEFMFSGILERFPRLKVVSVESGIGWVPYFLELCDDVYQRQQHWAKSDLRMLPSRYAARQLYWNFWSETSGLRLLDVIGEDRVMWESDYPHSICKWPNSWRVIDEICAGIPPATRQKILVENAQVLYQLD